GAIGTGTAFTRNNLSVGGHIITLTATDSRGTKRSSSRTLTITTSAVPNEAPVAWISAPVNALSVAQGTSVSFSGAATDPEDGMLSGASLAWTSDRDGAIGTGSA